MNIKKNIVIFVRLATELAFWQHLLNYDRFYKNYNVSLVFTSDEVQESFKSFGFLYESSLFNADSENFDYSRVDLILCQELTPQINKKFLEEAVENNIPVLLYEHGALLASNSYDTSEDEIFQSYRADITMASQVACWGNRNKECWLSFGVEASKIFVTGAFQYDNYHSLNLENATGLDSYLQEEIKDKKVILFFATINHPSVSDSYNNKNIELLKQLESFVEDNKDYCLLVKPHPSSMEIPEAVFDYGDNTILISNQYEKAWEKTVKVDVDEIAALSEIVFLPASSALIGPVILQKPIVVLDIDWSVNNNFKQYAAGRLLFVDDISKVDKIILNRDVIFNDDFAGKQKELSQDLAYDVGKAKDNFIALIDKIFSKQDEGIAFYLSREDAYIENINRMPDLPYSYKHLINYYFENNRYDDVFYWLDKCAGKFKFFKGYLNRLIWEIADKNKAVPFIDKYLQNKVLSYEDVYSFIRLFREKKDYISADFILDFLIDRDTLNQELYLYEKGFNCFSIKQYTEALKYFDLATVSASDESLMIRILLKKGEVCLKLEDNAVAAEHFKACLEKNHNHNLARKYLEEVIL